MNLAEYNIFCGAMPASTHVVQWRGMHAWKVGGKVFAIAALQSDMVAVTFKTSHIAYEMLKEQEGLRPAPYLASRGMKWIQNYAESGLSDDELKGYIRESYALVTQGLTKKLRFELGLLSQ